MEDYSQVYELWVANVFQSDRQVIFSSRIQNGDHSKDYKLVMLVDQKQPCAGLIASLVKLGAASVNKRSFYISISTELDVHYEPCKINQIESTILTSSRLGDLSLRKSNQAGLAAKPNSFQK